MRKISLATLEREIHSDIFLCIAYTTYLDICEIKISIFLFLCKLTHTHTHTHVCVSCSTSNVVKRISECWQRKKKNRQIGEATAACRGGTLVKWKLAFKISLLHHRLNAAFRMFSRINDKCLTHLLTLLSSHHHRALALMMRVVVIRAVAISCIRFCTHHHFKGKSLKFSLRCAAAVLSAIERVELAQCLEQLQIFIDNYFCTRNKETRKRKFFCCAIWLGIEFTNNCYLTIVIA